MEIIRIDLTNCNSVSDKCYASEVNGWEIHPFGFNYDGLLQKLGVSMFENWFYVKLS